MNASDTSSTGLRFGPDLKWVAVILFFIQMALSLPVFFPPLRDIGVWDEAAGINEGRELVQGKLPQFANNPTVGTLYALTYLPVHGSPFWLVHSCSIGRFVLFGLLWLSSFTVACQLAELANPIIMMAWVFLSPALSRLITNASFALFAAMSGFALWQFLAFGRTRKIKHLWLCSLFIGLAAWSRNEGPVLFSVFLVLSIISSVRMGLVMKALPACVVPFFTLVVGYILFYGLWTGDFNPGIKKRSYLTFEMGHGMAFAESYGAKEFYVEGQLEARRIFGTPEENHFSISNAIKRNPAAYLQRIVPLTRHAIMDAIADYGWYFALLCFAFAARGIVALIKARLFALLAALLLWPAYCVLYVLLCYQKYHLLMPFLSVLSLATIGVHAFALNVASRWERYVWMVGLLGFIIIAATRGAISNGPLSASLVLALGFCLIWHIADRFRAIENCRVVGLFVLLSLGLIVQFGLEQSEARLLGSGTDEKAVLYLSEHFKKGSRIAAWGPGKVWNAKMAPVAMARDFRSLKSAQDVSEWIRREKIDAIYVDDDLRRYESVVYDTIEKQIGSSLSVAFDAGEGSVQVLVPKTK